MLFCFDCASLFFLFLAVSLHCFLLWNCSVLGVVVNCFSKVLNRCLTGFVWFVVFCWLVNFMFWLVLLMFFQCFYLLFVFNWFSMFFLKVFDCLFNGFVLFCGVCVIFLLVFKCCRYVCVLFCIGFQMCLFVWSFCLVWGTTLGSMPHARRQVIRRIVMLLSLLLVSSFAVGVVVVVVV